MNIELSSSDFGEPLRKPWKNAIAIGRAAELLRADVLQHLRAVQKRIGYRYCRFHGLFHDEMAVVGRRSDGALAFRWHHVDKVYDALLELGLRPFVELNPMPSQLASGSQTIFDWKMNVTPPGGYGEWSALVEAFARHLLDRYGDRGSPPLVLRSLNEPNLSGFWERHPGGILAALRSLGPRAQKGLASTPRRRPPRDFQGQLDLGDHRIHRGERHTARLRQHPPVPRRTNLSSMRTARAAPHQLGHYFRDTVRHVQETVKASRRPDLEIHWTEWNSLSTDATARVTWTENSTVDSLFGAAFVCAACTALDDACDTLCWWVASDVFEETGMPHAEFTCTYGLITINGLPKATFTPSNS